MPRSIVTSESGQKLTMNYETRQFIAIVVDPNGIGEGLPTIGFGFNMMEKYAGIPQSTLTNWVTQSEGVKVLKLPSGKTLRVTDCLVNDGNVYSVIEASDWIELAFDLLENPGRTSKSLKGKLIAFLKWFTVKGFYAEAYVGLKGNYSAKDSRVLSEWIVDRKGGIPTRNFYTDLLQSCGCIGYQYAIWTNLVYQGLFGMTAKEMKQTWDLVDGTARIARNYIPEAVALKAVAFCEDMVVRMYVDNLEQAHLEAIALTKRKFAAFLP